jgi:hypothetical protein
MGSHGSAMTEPPVCFVGDSASDFAGSVNASSLISKITIIYITINSKGSVAERPVEGIVTRVIVTFVPTKASPLVTPEVAKY